MHIRFVLFLLTAYIATASSPATAELRDCVLPRSLKTNDKILWEAVRASGEPREWVKYFVTNGCYRDEARRLFFPMLALPERAKGYPTVLPTPEPVYAPNRLKFFTKFSGDRTQTIYERLNGQSARFDGIAEIYHFQLSLELKVANIPKKMYKKDRVAEAEKDVALWIEYQCAVGAQPYGPVYGAPGKTPGICSSSVTPIVFDRINLALKGPYAEYFRLDAVCLRAGDVQTNCTDAVISPIRGITITLVPIRTFGELLSDGHLPN